MFAALVFLMWAGSASSTDSDNTVEKSSRSPKYLSYYSSYLEPPQMLLNKVASEFPDRHSAIDYNQENELSSTRSRPPQAELDSPMYFIKLPPSPYTLVPGMGFVSRPPQLRPPPVVQPRPQSPIYNLPLKIVSNAKLMGIYTWKQDSPLTNLNKGPYNFNGRPTDLYLLKNSYNPLYDNGIHNYYH